jgi:hypothetical protein
MTAESSLAQVVKELQSSNLSQDLILDTIDNYDFTLASNVAKENMTGVPNFLDKLVNVAGDLKDKFDVLIRSNVVLAKRLEGNKLQEREDRDELLDALGGLKPDKTRSAPAKNSKIEIPGGIFGKLAGLLAGLFAAGGPFAGGLLKGLGNIFAARGPFAGGLLKGLGNIFATLGKQSITKILPAGLLNMLSKLPKIFSIFGKLFKFAGPIGLAVTAVTGLIGTIMGAIKGYKEDGIMGAIEEGLLGLFNSVFASTIQVLADIGGWILKLFGLEKLGALLGPTVKQVIDQVIDNFRSLFTIFDAIISLDANKLTDELGKFFTNSWENIVKPLGNLLLTGIMEIFPLVIKGFKFLLFDLPIFISNLGYKIIEYLITEGPGIIKKISVFIFDVIKNLFTEVFPNLFGTIFADVKNLFSSAGGSIGDMAGNLGDSINELYKSSIRAILPDPHEELSKLNPKYWVRAGIPDSIYKYAYSSSPKEKETSSEKLATSTSSSEKLATSTSSSEKLATSTSSSEKILKATSTNNFTELSKTEKAMAAGYGSWDEYAASDFKWKANIKATPLTTGNTLATAGNFANIAPTIVVNNNNGGNTNNISSSNVNNNATPMMPILTGSAMGY